EVGRLVEGESHRDRVVNLETHARAPRLAAEGGQRVRTEMQPDGMRRMEVKRIGPASTGSRYRHRHRRVEPARDREELAHGLLGHERKIAGEDQNRIRTAFGGAN